MNKAKGVSELSDKELKEYSYTITDSIFLYEELADESDKEAEAEKEKLIALAKELAAESKRRKKKQTD